MNKKPKIAFWYRYGPAVHSELIHNTPEMITRLAADCEVHYYGMKTDTALPESIKRNAIIHELPIHINRTNNRDKLIKTVVWTMLLPLVAIHSRFTGIKAVYIDEAIPFTALIARIFFGNKVAFTVGDFFTDIYFTGSYAPVGKLIKAIDIWSWKRLALIFTRANSTREWLVKQGLRIERIYTVYDPCDLNLYHPLTTEERLCARSRFGFSNDDIVLVHHGILHPNKGNDIIIRAIAEARRDFPTLRYLLVGDGPEMKKLRKLISELKIEDACTLTGWLPTLPEVNQALNAGDIGLVMRVGARSDDFHMTGALVHSMACGLPLLAARLGGVCEIISEGRNGLLFNPTDMNEFKSKLEKLIRSPELRSDMGKIACEDARIHFDMQRSIQNTITPLLKIAGVETKNSLEIFIPPAKL